MLRYIDSKKMGRGSHGWLDSYFHFSFAEYRNEENINFGALRVINDDLIQPSTGFDAHPHRDMEILTYIVDGELTHQDSMQNEHTLIRGEVQYMSAGTGVIHSEYNRGTKRLRILQIWILPDREGYAPNYGDYRFRWDDRQDQWLPIASWTENGRTSAPIRIHQDINMYVTLISQGSSLDFITGPGRQTYLVQIEGESQIENIHLHERDALEITEQNISISALSPSHMLAIEMAKG